MGAGRRRALRLEKQDTGAINYYGELKPAQVIGVRYCSAMVRTRPHTWRIERKNSSPHSDVERAPCTGGTPVQGETRSDSSLFSYLGPVAITVRGPDQYNAPSTWANPNETSQAGPRLWT